MTDERERPWEEAWEIGWNDGFMYGGIDGFQDVLDCDDYWKGFDTASWDGHEEERDEDEPYNWEEAYKEGYEETRKKAVRKLAELRSLTEVESERLFDGMDKTKKTMKTRRTSE